MEKTKNKFGATNAENDKSKQKIDLVQNFESSTYLFDWFNKRMPENMIDTICGLSGIEIMEDNVVLINTDTNETISFKEDLGLFSANPDEYESKYGLTIAYEELEKSNKLLTKIQSTDIDLLVTKRALEYFPCGTKFETPANIYYVLTGWEWGDAYVRNIKEIDGKYRIVKDGNPVVMFNLSLITKLYGETPEEQFQILAGVMSHEIFHFAFSEFKTQSSNYPQISKTDFKTLLINTVQDEGVAHYIDKKEELKTNFEKFEKYQEKNFEKLNEALKLLSSKQIDDVEKNKILQEANIGKYWSKYGAIAGMFMTYHIERILGKDMITKTLENGAESFIETYIELQSKHNELPKLQSC